MTRAVVISVASTLFVCGLGFAGYLRFAGASTISSPSCEIRSPEGAPADRAQGESLRKALAAIVAAQATGEQPPIAPIAPKANDDTAGEITSVAQSWIPPTKEELAAKQKADLQSLDAQLLRENVDPRWASNMIDATSQIVGRYASMHLDEITCRETLCRARIKHLDLRSHDEDIDRLLGLPFITGQSIVFDEPGAPENATFYFSREGMPLSVLQAPVVAQPPAAAFTADNGSLYSRFWRLAGRPIYGRYPSGQPRG